ncbi:MAG: hypothetical protein SV760_10265 [Halobacteria archaeon]|nr:hypothetical protein [Halobacteria archaeon]
MESDLTKELETDVEHEDHIGRRFLHMLSSVVGVAYVFGILAWGRIQLLTGLGTLIIVALEFDRLVLGNSLFDPLYRDYEEETPAGYAFAVVGMFIAVALYPPSVAVVAVFVLAFADPIVGIIGTGKLRRVKPPRVLASMFVLAFVIAIGSSYVFDDVLVSVVGQQPLGFLNPFPDVEITVGQALVGALGATFADGVKYRVKGYVVDDNVTIPVYSGALMTLYGLLPLGF